MEHENCDVTNEVLGDCSSSSLEGILHTIEIRAECGFLINVSNVILAQVVGENDVNLGHQ